MAIYFLARLFYGISFDFMIKVIHASSINVAYGKPTRQYPWTYCESRPSPVTVAGGHYCHNSSFAVDGNMDTCSRTIGNESDTYGLWLVYLEQPYVLHSLKIYRNLSDDLQNQSLGLTVYGFSPRGTRQKIIHDSNPTTRNQSDILVPRRLRALAFSRISIYVRGYQVGNKVTVPHLTLCEVQVFTDNLTTMQPNVITAEPARSLQTQSLINTTILSVTESAADSIGFSPLLAGLIATGLALAAILIAILVFALRKCKRRKEETTDGYLNAISPQRESETNPYTSITSCGEAAYETTANVNRTDCPLYDSLNNGEQFMQDEGPYAAQSEVSVMSDCPHYCTLGEKFDPPIRKETSRTCSLCAAATGETVYATIEKTSDCYRADYVVT